MICKVCKEPIKSLLFPESTCDDICYDCHYEKVIRKKTIAEDDFIKEYLELEG